MTDQHGPDSADPQVKSEGVTRRGVLRGAAGAGVVAAAAGIAVETTARPAGATTLQAGAGGEPVIAHVRDVRTGEIEVFVGERRVVLYDREVAIRLANAAR
ncbi:MAG: hypothetical protein J2P17_24030 [Mycobacterium sp.]|nr:hypothetical protein [Mycobacterium sp.]